MAKITLKCGEAEITYDGPEDFLKSELQTFVAAVGGLRSVALQKKGAGSEVDLGGESSVSTLAQQLAVKNGPDLIIASALSLVRSGSQTFTKKQLRERMRAAAVFYKAAYSNNFDTYVARLVKKGRLNHTGGTNYSLPSEELRALAARLGSTEA
jgi:hypothetical protein